jgi:hypothetical protein
MTNRPPSTSTRRFTVLCVRGDWYIVDRLRQRSEPGRHSYAGALLAAADRETDWAEQRYHYITAEWRQPC